MSEPPELPTGHDVHPLRLRQHSKYMRGYRAMHKERYFNLSISPAAAADLAYLQQAWGLGRREMIQAAIQYLAKLTRKGLPELDLDP